jgi:hypothetical protein
MEQMMKVVVKPILRHYYFAFRGEVLNDHPIGFGQNV